MDENTSEERAGAVAVVDDQEAVCAGCKLVLTDRGYRVTTYLTGESGFDGIRRDEVDVVLLDLKLPDIDGMDLLRRIHEEKPEMNIIVMTGYASVQSAVSAMKLGAFDYLAKPFEDDELLFSVDKAVRNKRLVEENVALRKQLFAKYNFSHIVGENPELLKIFNKIRKAAPTDVDNWREFYDAMF